MSPKSKEQYEEIRQKSIATIKEVALELFGHNGYHSTSISQITKAAGISKGLIYNYFDSKKDLLHSIIMDAVELGEDLMKELMEIDDPYEQLKKMTDITFEMVKGNIHYWKLLTSLAFQTDVLKEEEEWLSMFQKKAIEFSVNIFERMGVPEPKKEAFLHGALVDGIIIHYLQMEPDYPLDEMKEFILKKYLKPVNKER